ncbi:hypothetical protein BDY19DRAFT_923767 [Irpex rosettiformis]|uniref:Uncharacterized protein n=1 Tax=Irpex rosettiformis TaxID=378272 RepID=A0ACB8UH05_9APHY|nr:hypothetical protein BDY19DRAFT_923767 [Irpex rosettiformis]
MKCNKDLECEIICDDKPLEEYHITMEGENSMSCWVASEAGKAFTVKINNRLLDVDFVCVMHIDGQLTNKRPVRRNTSDYLKGMRVGNSQIRSYMFSPIRLTDNEEILEQGPRNLKDIGKICLKWHRAKIELEQMGNVSQTENTRREGDGLEDGALHEKAKKLGGHRVILGVAQDMPEGSYIYSSASYLDSIDAPYFTFTWRYRPKEILQAQGIMPNDEVQPPNAKRPRPSASLEPKAGPSKRLRENQEEDQPGADLQVKAEAMIDLEALEAQRDALDEQIRRARQTLDVKREASPIVLGHANGVLIDLTED